MSVDRPQSGPILRESHSIEDRAREGFRPRRISLREGFRAKDARFQYGDDLTAPPPRRHRQECVCIHSKAVSRWTSRPSPESSSGLQFPFGCSLSMNDSSKIGWSDSYLHELVQAASARFL